MNVDDIYLLNPRALNVSYLLNRQEKEGEIELFVESLNKRDNRMIKEILQVPKIKEYTLRLHYFAKMEMDNSTADILSLRPASSQSNVLMLEPQTPKITFKSREGMPEIQEDLRQLCIAEDYPEKLESYLSCMSEQLIKTQTDQNDYLWKICADDAGLPIDKVTECSQSDRGIQALIEDINLAKELLVEMTPTLLVYNNLMIKGESLKFFFTVNRKR